MPRTVDEILQHADQFAARFVDYGPDPADEFDPEAVALLRAEIQERSDAERHVLDAVKAARQAGMSWAMTPRAPAHPGEVLLEEYLRPLGISQNRLAVAIGVPPKRISGIVHGKRRIMADTALRLSRYFGTSDRFWLNLQTRFDLEKEGINLGAALDRIQPLHIA